MKTKTMFDRSDAFSMDRFQVDEKSEDTYAHYVSETAKLLKRPYITVHKMVESWPIDKIIRRYEECTKHAGTMPGDVKWWWLRKQELSKR